MTCNRNPFTPKGHPSPSNTCDNQTPTPLSTMILSFRPNSAIITSFSARFTSRLLIPVFLQIERRMRNTAHMKVASSTIRLVIDRNVLPRVGVRRMSKTYCSRERIRESGTRIIDHRPISLGFQFNEVERLL